LKKHWPLPAALAVLYAVLGVSLAASLAQNDGHFVYALDDPYIHMAVAKNLAEHGVYGVTPHGFSYSTSSIVWPWLLWLTHLICGPNTIGPLAWNVGFATAAVSLIYALLKKQGVPPRLNFAFLLIISFGTPLPAIIFTGLEHTLHVLLAVAFLFVAAKFLAQGSVASETSPRGLRALYFALPVLLTMTRYESALMIAVVCLLWVIRGRIRHAVVLGALAALPIILSGLISLAHGWHFLPNSVLLKGRMPPGSSLEQVYRSLHATAATLYRQPHLPAMLAAAILLLVVLHRTDRRRWTVDKNMLWILLLIAALHVQFAKTGWFFRYEAYLMACGLFAVLTVAYEQLARAGRPVFSWRPHVLRVAMLLVVVASAIRGVQSTASIPLASSNIYQQHFQMARFVARYYAGRGVAANDVGAINYYVDIHNLDLWGLCSLEVADARLAQQYGPEIIDRLAEANRIDVAMVYDHWFERYYGGLPPTWQKVAEWEIADNLVCGGRCVSFYAVKADQRRRLAENLAEFSADLPGGVIQRGPFSAEEQPVARVAVLPNSPK
ncbi:MAG TPA: hypothetical protein VMY42_00845, partial [Thermoguttaceae bacterium]|nr:hypothetical protein [Thermoguttaceae bacterium]